MVMLWGSNARETHPIFFHHLLKGVHNGARLISVDPRRTRSAQWADLWLGPRRRLRHRARQRDGARDHPLGPPQPHLHQPRHHRLRGVRRLRRALHARGRRAAHRRARQGHPRGRPRIRARGPGDDLLDARDHRAPQRGGQRPRADQPRPAVRPRGPLGLGPQPAARPEQRAGRRRHGRDPQQAARLPGHRERRRRAGPVRARLGRADPPALRLAPHRRCSRRWSTATCARST